MDASGVVGVSVPYTMKGMRLAKKNNVHLNTHITILLNIFISSFRLLIVISQSFLLFWLLMLN